MKNWDMIWRKVESPTVRRQFLLKLCGYVKLGLILDQGCGTAQTDVALATMIKGALIVSSDFSLGALKMAKKRSRQEGVHLNLMRCDVLQLPFRSQVFSSVFSEEVLEHINDPETLLSETQRVLKRGGRFVLSVPNRMSPFYAIWRRILTCRGKWIYGNEHPYTSWRVKRLLRRHDFASEEEFYFEMPKVIRFLDFYSNPLCVRFGMASIRVSRS